MAINSFSGSSDKASDPSTIAFTVTPSDAVELAIVPKALYVGTGGNITLRSLSGTADVVLKNVASGQVIDIRASFVRATGTTATDIVGLA